jgi:hypothetical protein
MFCQIEGLQDQACLAQRDGSQASSVLPRGPLSSPNAVSSSVCAKWVSGSLVNAALPTQSQREGWFSVSSAQATSCQEMNWDLQTPRVTKKGGVCVLAFEQESMDIRAGLAYP